jgi:hypothetical protein
MPDRTASSGFLAGVTATITASVVLPDRELTAEEREHLGLGEETP